MDKEMAKKVLAGIFALTAATGLVKTTYDSIEHDRRIQADFREAVNQDTTPHLMTVVTDGVTRQGFVNKGAALAQDSSTALIVASTPEAACWYTTLRVIKGQEKLPFWQKIFGGAESEVMFANQALDNMRCAPTGNGQTIETIGKKTAVTMPAAPALGK